MRDATRLVTGGDNQFLPVLLDAINRAEEIDIAVAFVRQTGLSLLHDALYEAVTERGARLRFLTSTYMNVTDPQALRNLLLLEEEGAQVRVFEADRQSFHLKTYLFVRTVDGKRLGNGYVGSSNISRAALTDGIEWNLRTDSTDASGAFQEARQSFAMLFADFRAKPITQKLVDDYYKSARVLPPEGAGSSGADEIEPPPVPTSTQEAALVALQETRAAGYKRGLVVMATGLGKTWLAAFDTNQFQAERVLFVAHREEILHQAEATFVRIRREASVGRYTGNERQLEADMIFASVQTLSKTQHLDRFDRDHFDYVIVDEFHHAAAGTYQRLLAHFEPKFLLGLTATPERTDNADILGLCDDNLVYTQDLFDGIKSELLAPFHYHGIGDKSVNYQAIPWRSGKFDEEKLLAQIATEGRAAHVFEVWRQHKQTRTLAFCVAIRHADFMAAYFERKGVRALSVHSQSEVRRNEALTMLRAGRIDVIFSVDLFNEGVDVPLIDTVLMLRPTESKILFLQQLGRGLRKAEGKSNLVALDFIGNHLSFFRKPEALFGIGVTNVERRVFLEKAERKELELPPGCFANYDLQAIDFMKGLTASRVDQQLEIYRGLRESKGRRPTIGEFYYGGGAVQKIRQEHGSWFRFVQHEGDLDEAEARCVRRNAPMLQEAEVTNMSKCFKMILLRAFVELDGFAKPPMLRELALASHNVLQRMPRLAVDLPEQFRDNVEPSKWLSYWRGNPIAAWLGENRKSDDDAAFRLEDDRLVYSHPLQNEDRESFHGMLNELITFRLLQYEARLADRDDDVDIQPPTTADTTGIPFFTDLEIACGFFRTSPHERDKMEQRRLPSKYGALDPARHFIARASGNSMKGGPRPIEDGNLLLMERIDPTKAGSISGQLVAVETQDDAGSDQYLLRRVEKLGKNHYQLVAANPDPKYQPIEVRTELGAEHGPRTFARFVKRIAPEDVVIHQSFMRADIPPIFGLPFQDSIWNTGHVCPKGYPDHFLLVTLNKRSMNRDHRYHDYFIDADTFHWQSQNSTGPTGKRGREIINHVEDDRGIHLWVRKHKMAGKTAAPFVYCGKVRYQSHEGEKPMSVTWQLETPLSPELIAEFQVSS